MLTPEQLEAYATEGYIVVRSLFTTQEIDLLRRASKEDRELEDHSYGREDGEGGVVRLSLWNHPGDGIYGMFARCLRLVEAMEQLLGGEVYHYHSKMIMKEPKVGGAWAWHQDYGYWYQNGCLLPLMASAVIAVDPATRENGCMQFLAGSHEMGRVHHVLSGEQAGADSERVEAARGVFNHVYCDLSPGDVVFFHCNLLHRSDANRSELPRWSMICCYNAARNDPYKESGHPRYTPLKKVPDQAILDVGIKRFAEDGSDVGWQRTGKNESTRNLEPDA